MKLVVILCIALTITIGASADSKGHKSNHEKKYYKKHHKEYKSNRHHLKKPKFTVSHEKCSSPCFAVFTISNKDKSLEGKDFQFRIDPGDGTTPFLTRETTVTHKYIFIDDGRHEKDHDDYKHKKKHYKKHKKVHYRKKHFKPRVSVVFEGRESKAKKKNIKVEGRPNTAPQIQFVIDKTQINEGDSIKIDLSGSTDAEDNIEKYRATIDGVVTENTTGVFDHTFSAFGSYTVEMEVVDEFGLSAAAYLLIIVNAYPIAQFSFDPITGKSPLVVNLDASSSSDPDGTSLQYSWELSDGSSFATEKAIHTLQNETETIYSIKLTVTDANGAINSLTKPITVLKPNVAPLASLSLDTIEGEAPLTVSMDGSASTDSDGKVVSYSFNISNGQEIVGTSSQASYNLTVPGDYTITLVVLDNDGASHAVVQNVTVLQPNLPPVAEFNFDPITGKAPLLVNFNASPSYDPDGSIVKYRWRTTYEGLASKGRKFSHVFLTEGYHWVRLNVFDDKGANAVIFKYIFVLPPNVAPVANLYLDKTQGHTPFTVSMNGSSSTDIDGSIVNYDFEISSGEVISNGTSSATYTFVDPGDYQVTLKVTDSYGDVAQVTRSITVTEDPNPLPPDPGKAGKATLAGIDSNDNGVRDDVEIIIAGLEIAPEKKEMLKDFSKFIQKGLVSSVNKQDSIKESYNKINYSYCIESSFTPEEIDTVVTGVQIEHLNTKERVLAFALNQEHFGGQLVVIDTDIYNYGKYCDL